MVSVFRHEYREGSIKETKLPHPAWIITVCDGYAMLRMRGHAPFVENVKNLERYQGHE